MVEILIMTHICQNLTTLHYDNFTAYSYKIKLGNYRLVDGPKITKLTNIIFKICETS